MQKLLQALILVLWNMVNKPNVTVTAEKVDGTYQIGISPILKTGFVDKIVGGFQEAGATALLIVITFEKSYCKL